MHGDHLQGMGPQAQTLSLQANALTSSETPSTQVWGIPNNSKTESVFSNTGHGTTSLQSY